VKAKFIDITSFDREVDDNSDKEYYWETKDARYFSPDSIINVKLHDQNIDITEKVYHRIIVFDTIRDIGYQPYTYFVNYETIKHAVPIIMAEVEKLKWEHKKELREKENEMREMRIIYKNMKFRDKIRNTIKIWFNKKHSY